MSSNFSSRILEVIFELINSAIASPIATYPTAGAASESAGGASVSPATASESAGGASVSPAAASESAGAASASSVGVDSVSGLALSTAPRLSP